MAYVPDCEFDVFVSYAHVDDEPDVEGEVGWVTNLIDSLQRRLRKYLGGSKEFSLWIDKQLARHVQITPEIVSTVEKTAALIVVLSPSYLNSPWCERERQTFLEAVSKRVRSGSRVFIVEPLKVELEDRPDELGDVVGYRFWVQESLGGAPRTLGTPRPTPEDRAYYDMLNDLAYDLAKELKKLKQEKEAAFPRRVVVPEPSGEADPETPANVPTLRPAEVQPDEPELVDIAASVEGAMESEVAPANVTVYLAQVTEDLYLQRKQLKRSFEQQGIHVVPDVVYPRDPQTYRKAVAGDLRRAALFVQLLSPESGTRLSDNGTESYVSYQLDCARQRKMPVLQWREPQADVEQVAAGIEDELHRRLYNGPTVQARPINGFIRDAIDEAKRISVAAPETPTSTGRAIIFVDVESEDQDLASQLCTFLARTKRYTIFTPIQSGRPQEIREDFESRVKECHAFIIIYGQSDNKWVRARYSKARQLELLRERPFLGLAVYEGPPKPKDPINVWDDKLKFIHCEDGFDPRQLAAFLADLKEAVRNWIRKRRAEG